MCTLLSTGWHDDAAPAPVSTLSLFSPFLSFLVFSYPPSFNIVRMVLAGLTGAVTIAEVHDYVNNKYVSRSPLRVHQQPERPSLFFISSFPPTPETVYALDSKRPLLY